jgi:hypothetical protein
MAVNSEAPGCPVPKGKVEAVTQPDVPRDSRTIRVLFVGNSYTYTDDIPWITKQLATAAGESLDVEMIAPPGATLQYTWEQERVQRRLRESKWDFVVLQEQSIRSVEQPQAAMKYADLFDFEIRRAGAKTILFFIWPRQYQPENYAPLTNTFFRIAKKLDAVVAPVGIAWMNALKENPKLPLYSPDRSHPGPVGSYLAGCVFYSVLHGKSPAGLPRTLYTVKADGSRVAVGNLSDADAELIQRAAWQSVQSTLEPKGSQ